MVCESTFSKTSGTLEPTLIKNHYSVCVAGIVCVVFLHTIHIPKIRLGQLPPCSCGPALSLSLESSAPVYRGSPRYFAAAGLFWGPTIRVPGIRKIIMVQRALGPIVQDTIDLTEEDGPHGEEVQLTRFPGWPMNFLHGKGSRDSVACPAQRFRLKKRVQYRLPWTE